ncbi:hypothetical protein B0H10DRAFT_1960671 [Mycena sp. CBHHK59/15]|nr:hypothetical protein B0H10DRAFT_1960671 [Mycena sp. CBHHK59/15]
MATVEFDVITLHQDQYVMSLYRLTRLIQMFILRIGACGAPSSSQDSVVLYDYLLTLGSEVENLWGPRFRRSSAWFLLFRYVTLLSNLTMVAFFLGNLNPEIENYLLVVQEFFIGCSLSLRVCAMYGFNRKVFISLSIAALTTVGLGAWAVVGPKLILETSVPACHVTTSKNQSVHERISSPDVFDLICSQVDSQVFNGLPRHNELTPPSHRRSVGMGSPTRMRYSHPEPNPSPRLYLPSHRRLGIAFASANNVP